MIVGISTHQINTSKYVDLPYVSKGRDFKGVDCWGLIYLIFKIEFGILIPSWSAEYENANKVQLKKFKDNSVYFNGWVEIEKPEVNSVILFEMGKLFHVGLCLDKRGREMLHIMRGTKVTIEKLDSALWKYRQKWGYKYNAE
jgi:hypothetical protein